MPARQFMGMRKAIWRLALFWPLIALWIAASAAHFLFTERLARVLSLTLIIAGMVCLQLWTRRFDRKHYGEKLMRWLGLEPRDLGL